MNNVKKYLWVEEYSPQTVEDCILPKDIKSKFLKFRDEKRFPNLILSGPAGVGKTSLVKALCEEIDADVLFVNASLDRGIGDVRTTVAGFASTASMYGGQKVVILDEADNLTQDSQKALRALVEEFQNHCTFVLTCNYPHNIIDAIHSRCSVFDFGVRDPSTLTKLGGEMFKRCITILKSNDIPFDKDVLAKYIMDAAPDWRGILNNLQSESKEGAITNNILRESADALVKMMRDKQWKDVSEWIFSHSQIHPKSLERDIYKSLQKHLEDQSKPQAVIHFGEYSHKITQGADPSITLLALVTEIMATWKFK